MILIYKPINELPILLAFLFTIFLFGSCKNNSAETEENNSVLPAGTPILNYSVTNSFPHDTSLFTEGFLIHDGQLFESTGSPKELISAKSLIGIVDLKTGKIDEKIKIDKAKYFGEGIVFLKDKLYQLTYKNQICFIYDSKSFKQLGKFNYLNTEGWGLTTDGKDLIMSDGTDTLTFLDPNDLKPIKTLTVTENGLPMKSLNELEYIKGFIYANIWTTDFIAKIDPVSGRVVGKLNLSSLVNEAKNKNPKADVLNGIAYDSTSNKIFVTGKLWPNIYQLDFPH